MDTATLVKQVKSELETLESEARTLYKEFTDARDAKAAEHGAEKLTADREIFNELHELNRAYSEKADAAAEKKEQLMRLLEWEGKTPGGFESATSAETKTGSDPVAKTIAESPAYKRLIESGVLKQAGTRVQSDPIELLSKAAVGDWLEGKAAFKDLLTGAGPPGETLLRPTRLAGIQEILYQPVTLLNLIATGQMSGDSIEYVRQTDFDNQAATVPEATAVDDDDAIKPESGMAFDVVPEVAHQVAHWIPATKRALADIDNLETLVRTQLEDGIRRKLEEYIISGNGTTDGFRGILNTPSVLTPSPGANALESVFAGMTAVRLGFLEPNAVVLNPQDFADIRLLRDDSGAAAGTGAYLFGPPSQVGDSTIFGLRTVTTTALDPGTALVGQFNQAILWNREGITTIMTDSHADFFIRNLVVILSEMRAAFGVLRPQAFAIIDLS